MILKLDFYGVVVHCHINIPELFEALEKDFFYFVNNNSLKPDIELTAHKSSPPYDEISGLIADRQTLNCINYKQGDIQYSDYYGDALVKYSFNQERGEIYSLQTNSLHEILYLLILSRTGKSLEQKGFHKVHAMGVSHKEKAIVISMPMKGGKTTLFLNMLQNTSNSIISDDTPLIDKNGNIYSFPLRVGVENTNYIPKEMHSHLYTLERKQYGKKTLIPISSFPNKISQKCSQAFYFEGIRRRGSDCTITKATKLKSFKYLTKHMVVGIGLPLILEFFVEGTISDWFKLIGLLFKRIRAAVNFLRRSETYIVYLGDKPKHNALVIQEFIESKI